MSDPRRGELAKILSRTEYSTHHERTGQFYDLPELLDKVLLWAEKYSGRPSREQIETVLDGLRDNGYSSRWIADVILSLYPSPAPVRKVTREEIENLVRDHLRKGPQSLSFNASNFINDLLSLLNGEEKKPEWCCKQWDWDKEEKLWRVDSGEVYMVYQSYCQFCGAPRPGEGGK